MQIYPIATIPATVLAMDIYSRLCHHIIGLINRSVRNGVALEELLCLPRISVVLCPSLVSKFFGLKAIESNAAVKDNSTTCCGLKSNVLQDQLLALRSCRRDIAKDPVSPFRTFRSAVSDCMKADCVTYLHSVSRVSNLLFYCLLPVLIMKLGHL